MNSREVVDIDDHDDTKTIGTSHVDEGAILAAAGRLSIMASFRQQGNPILDHLKELKVIFSDTLVPDYLLSNTVAVLFVTLKYHRLHSGYLEHRIRTLKKDYRLRLLLCLVDLPDFEKPLEEVTISAFVGEMTLMLSWTAAEAAKIIQAFKQLEEKSPEIIQGKLKDKLSSDRAIEVLTEVSSINKVDAMLLLKEFSSIQNIVKASKEELARCPGIGPKKLRDLWKALHGSLEKPDAKFAD